MEINHEALYTAELKELYTILLQLISHTPEIKHTETTKLEKIRHGIGLKLPILYLTNYYYEDMPSYKKTKVWGHGKYPIVNFHDEIDARKILIINLIDKYTPDTGLTTPRGEY